MKIGGELVKYFFFGKINYLFGKVKFNKCGKQEKINWCGFIVHFKNNKCGHLEKSN